MKQILHIGLIATNICFPPNGWDFRAWPAWVVYICNLQTVLPLFPPPPVEAAMIVCHCILLLQVLAYVKGLWKGSDKLRATH